MGLHTHRADAATIGWYTEYFSGLIGAKVVGFEMKKGDDEEWGDGEWWPSFTFEMPDGSKRECELSQDEEGNGPGFIFGLDTPPPVKS